MLKAGYQPVFVPFIVNFFFTFYGLAMLELAELLAEVFIKCTQWLLTS
jgi:hypothetical protein